MVCLESSMAHDGSARNHDSSSRLGRNSWDVWPMVHASMPQSNLVPSGGAFIFCIGDFQGGGAGTKFNMAAPSRRSGDDYHRWTPKLAQGPRAWKRNKHARLHCSGAVPRKNGHKPETQTTHNRNDIFTEHVKQFKASWHMGHHHTPNWSPPGGRLKN